MKKCLIFSLLFVNLFSCKENKLNNLYSFQYDNEIPLLKIDEYNKLISLKASFPLLVYSPKCSSSCSLFPLYFKNYLKKENVFFPVIYENNISKVNNIFSGNTYLCIIEKGKIKHKEEVSYFNDHEINDYVNTYFKKNEINIINDISFLVKEDDLELSSFSSYSSDSKLSDALVKNNNVLIINDNLIKEFDSEYYKKISNIKYIYFSSFLNDSFYSDFNVDKNENIYNLLSYKDNKYSFEGY